MEDCTSCNKQISVKEVNGTSVVIEVPDKKGHAVRYAFLPDEDDENLCPTCRRSLRYGATGDRKSGA